jgi:hypothetical protein
MGCLDSARACPTKAAAPIIFGEGFRRRGLAKLLAFLARKEKKTQSEIPKSQTALDSVL